MLDCGEDKPDSHKEYSGLNDFTQLRLDQVAFLDKELSSDDFRNADKRVLIHHIPIYGWGKRAYDPSGELWRPLLVSAPFDIAINGHTHTPTHYPRGSTGNNFPVVVGGGGSVDIGTVMILNRKGDELRLKMISAAGETLYELTH
jgi:2',3'-cyclic-nucleotide 2'-phosphodiesterase (5'-nucleotidase family)